MSRRARGNVFDPGVYETLNKPRARLVRTNNHTVVTSTSTAIIWDTLLWDTDGMWTLTSPTRLTCRTAGLYDVKGQATWTQTVGGIYRAAWFEKNHVTAERFGAVYQPIVANIEICNPTATISVNAGDYIELWVFQDSGGSILLQGGLGNLYAAEILPTFISSI